MGRWQSGQLQGTVNPSTQVYEGSNPSLPKLASVVYAMNKAKEQKLNTELDQLHSQRSIDMDSRFQCKLHANELIYILQVS